MIFLIDNYFFYTDKIDLHIEFCHFVIHAVAPRNHYITPPIIESGYIFTKNFVTGWSIV